MSFRQKIILFASVIILGATLLILNGKWSIDKVGETYTGINIANDETLREQPTTQSSAEPESLEFALHETPLDMPALTFFTADGQEYGFDQWQGRKLIVNLWATWCAPCVEEMPLLDNLKTILEQRQAGFDVIAISIDRQKSFADINRFFDKHGIENLVPFMDTENQVMMNMTISSFPVTYILNEQGQEIARYNGPLEWDHPKVIDALLKL